MKLKNPLLKTWLTLTVGGIFGLISCSEAPEYQEIKTDSSEAVRTSDDPSDQESGDAGARKSRERPESGTETKTPPQSTADNKDPLQPPANEGQDDPQAAGPGPVKELQFTWETPSDTDITSYIVKARDTTSGMIMDLTAMAVDQSVDLSMPQITVTMAGNNLLPSLAKKMVCFTLVAVNAAGNSDPSEESCVQL